MGFPGSLIANTCPQVKHHRGGVTRSAADWRSSTAREILPHIPFVAIPGCFDGLVRRPFGSFPFFGLPLLARNQRWLDCGRYHAAALRTRRWVCIRALRGLHIGPSPRLVCVWLVAGPGSSSDEARPALSR